MVLQVAVRPGHHAAAFSQPDPVLRSQIHQNQPPGHIVANVIAAPIRPRPIRQIIEQIHVDEQPDVVSHPVAPVAVDQQGAEIPYLQNNQRGYQIGAEGPGTEKTALHGVQQRIVPPDQIDKYQVIDQLDIFDFLFLGFLQMRFHAFAAPLTILKIDIIRRKCSVEISKIHDKL